MLVQRSVHLVMWSFVSTCCKRDTWAQKSPADFTECWCNSLRVSESIMEAALSADKHRKKKKKKRNITGNTRFNIISCVHHTTLQMFFFPRERSLENRLALLKNYMHFILFAKQFGSEALVLPKAIAVH